MRPERIEWIKGAHDFALDVENLLALQSRCDGDGIGKIARLLETGDYKLEHVMHTVALGLVGGGMERPRAFALVREVIEEDCKGIQHLLIVARVVLGLALQGYPDKEAPGDAKKTRAGRPKTR